MPGPRIERMRSAISGSFSSATVTLVVARNRFGRSMPVRITTGCFSRSALAMSFATLRVAVAVSAIVGGSPRSWRYSPSRE